MSHELVHYIHLSINERIKKLYLNYEVLKKRDEKSYSEFKKEGIEKEITMDSMLRLIVLFLDNLVVEGFAMLSEEMKAGKVVFNDAFYEANHKRPLALAQKCRSAFHESLIYFSQNNMDRSIDLIMSNFFTWYGREKPERLVRYYEAIMQGKGLIPVIGFGQQ